MAVRVKSTATVSAMLVIISSPLGVGVPEAQAESNRAKLKLIKTIALKVFIFFIISPRRTKLLLTQALNFLL
jgi:hypothetical protein